MAVHGKEKRKMETKSFVKPKLFIWAIVGFVASATLVITFTKLVAKPVVKTPPPPEVEVASVEQRDVTIYEQWIGTLAGHVNAEIKAQITGYLVTRNYNEGSYISKGQLLFQVDPRPFQAALDRAKGQLAQAQARLLQDQAQLAVAEATQRKTQLDVARYTPLAQASAVSRQDFDDAVQTNLANEAQVQAANAAIVAAKAQIQADQAAVETASINLGFTRIVSPIHGIVGIAQAQVGDLVTSGSGALTTVSTLDPIRDYFTVSEQEYLELRKRLSTSEAARWRLQLILADGTTYPREGKFLFAD